MTALTPVGITLGDAAGIGPEIIIKAYAQGLAAPCVVYGDAGALRRAANALDIALTVMTIEHPHEFSPQANQLAVIQRSPDLPADLPLGQLSAAAGQGAYHYITSAIDDALAGHIRAIVTAPINKQSLQLAGIDYPGHTEILADRSNTRDFAMMLVNDELRVLLVTIHHALADVMAQITVAAELKALRLAHRACLQLGIPSPRIAVAGLNPHAGEGGKFGREEIDIIAPAIACAQTEGINASGPWPGDTIFMRARRGEFDMVIAQYHDQGLIPVKYMGLDHGINVTVGLPFIRTSVDHGTAFDIAGKGLADPTSLSHAFQLALAMSAPT